LLLLLRILRRAPEARLGREFMKTILTCAILLSVATAGYAETTLQKLIPVESQMRLAQGGAACDARCVTEKRDCDSWCDTSNHPTSNHRTLCFAACSNIYSVCRARCPRP